MGRQLGSLNVGVLELCRPLSSHEALPNAPHRLMPRPWEGWGVGGLGDASNPSDLRDPLACILCCYSFIVCRCFCRRCYADRMPLGFLGQAAIIVAILMLVVCLCFMRRIHLFRLHGSTQQRSGFGLIWSLFTARAPRPPVIITSSSRAEAAATAAAAAAAE